MLLLVISYMSRSALVILRDHLPVNSYFKGSGLPVPSKGVFQLKQRDCECVAGLFYCRYFSIHTNLFLQQESVLFPYIIKADLRILVLL